MQLLFLGRVTAMKELHVSPHTLEFWVDGILYLFNPLSGALDSMQDVSKQEEWKRLRDRKTGSHELVEELSSRGYIYNDEQEEAALRARLQDLAEREASRAVRCHVILTYECNLRCVYCYEDGISRERGVIKDSRLTAMFAAVDQLSASGAEKTQVVLFGGEPLLNRSSQMRAVHRVLQYGAERGWELEVVTNGVDLTRYIPLLKECRVSQVQVTIDGPQNVHDHRRPRTSGRGSFAAIVRSVGEALRAELPVAVRVNVDYQNLHHAPHIADLFRAQGWFDQPSFGAYWGLTFDVNGRHQYCGLPHKILEKILDIRKHHPLTKRISLEAWEPLQFLLYPFFLGEPRMPKFFFCGAHRNEWCFDLRGDVYYCADSVGRPEFRVGRYIPCLQLDEEVSRLWRQHDSLEAPGCASCRAKLCCGGGCWFRRIAAVGSPVGDCCTEHVLPMLRVAMEYLHRTPELFEFAKNGRYRREEP
ncbi:MAG TPA: radical SAM protein [Candidatus Bipolaricaulis sp.]|nr:radical SAM protein [Candidatus Bipolaricaulis sp.]HRS14121.1 radical SAM protein [Candidatus Bipolaricaulis sp.]HRU21806.1 radical SAM protein [Candidatus Bipolaricaulis sp.]